MALTPPKSLTPHPQDFWNASTVGDYWRTWNMPVHKFLLRTIFFPAMRMGISRWGFESRLRGQRCTNPHPGTACAICGNHTPTLPLLTVRHSSTHTRTHTHGHTYLQKH